MRVTECFGVLRAEELYTALLKDNAAKVAPGAQGTAIYTPGDVRSPQAGKSVRMPFGGVGGSSYAARGATGPARGSTRDGSGLGTSERSSPHSRSE